MSVEDQVLGNKTLALQEIESTNKASTADGQKLLVLCVLATAKGLFTTTNVELLVTCVLHPKA